MLAIQSRQMQDNLVFYNIDERNDGENENTERLLQDFMKNELNMADEEINRVGIERCHRIGKKQPDKRRPIVAKMASSQSKESILKRGKNLAGTNFGISEQQPREYEERKKMLMPQFKKAKEENRKARWSKDKLIIDNKMITAPKTIFNDINLDPTSRAAELKVKRAPPKSVRGSTFQGNSVQITSEDDVIPAIQAVMKDTRNARGTHNIYAYRLAHNGRILEHYDDDSEYGAGRKLLSLLQEKDVTNSLICITRWHVGPNLGPIRFDYIKQAADSVISM